MILFLFLVTGCLLCGGTVTAAKDDTVVPTNGDTTYLLRYQFCQGEVLEWEVQHLLKVHTQVKGVTDVLETACRSTKRWTVKDVTEGGIAVIEHMVPRVEMQRRQKDRLDAGYNSEKDSIVPHGFAEVADNVGVPLANISLNSLGEVKKKLQLVPYLDGTFENKVLMVLPENPVAVGDSWKCPFEVPLSVPGGAVRKINLRQIFTLQDVKTGIATIAFRTEVLTPLAGEPKVESQLFDRIVHGTVKLDMDDGKVLEQQSDVNQRVIGFEGPSSEIVHRLRLTETRIVRD